MEIHNTIAPPYYTYSFWDIGVSLDNMDFTWNVGEQNYYKFVVYKKRT